MIKSKIVDVNETQNIEVFEVSVGTEDKYYNEDMSVWKRFSTQEDAEEYARGLTLNKDTFQGWGERAKFLLVEVWKVVYENEISIENIISDSICVDYRLDIKERLEK
nr:MAG TPA: ribonuclease HI [Caudoviricetes sp.]